MVILILVAGILLVGGAVLAHMWSEAHSHQIVEEEVEVSRLPDMFEGVKLLFLSDTHKRRLKAEDIEKLKDRVDWVLIGGDVAEKGIPWAIVRHNMSMLSSLAPAFMVYGNHDKRTGQAQLSRILQDCNVELLKDKSVVLCKGDDKISLIGLDHRSKQGDALLKNADTEHCRVVLIHDPLEALRLEENADLILSGHTHGGQIVLPFLGPIFLSKVYRVIPNGWFWLKRGEGDTREGKLLVSRGFGTNHLPLRLCCPAEMHLITLRQVQGNTIG